MKKLYLILYIVILKESYSQGAPLTMAETVFGKSIDPNCLGDCKLVERYLSIFPLRNEHIDNQTLLIQMDYKVLMFTLDNLIMFGSDTQKEVHLLRILHFIKNFFNL